MKFDENRVYTAFNADELKVGSKVIVANYLESLISQVEANSYPTYACKLSAVMGTSSTNRFKVNEKTYNLAYLVEPPEEKYLKASELKVGDILKNKKSSNKIAIVVDVTEERVLLNQTFWRNNQGLEEWEKVED